MDIRQRTNQGHQLEISAFGTSEANNNKQNSAINILSKCLYLFQITQLTIRIALSLSAIS